MALSRLRDPAALTVDLASQIDALLPQTQCRQCLYPDCRRYAEAIAAGEAPINQCPPGGEAGIASLAALLGRPVIPLNLAHGSPKPFSVAMIDESRCIGCTLCIQACPVDAIVGAAKLMHTVLSDQCSGCELCLAPCPVDCIDLVPAQPPAEAAQLWRRRHAQRSTRLQGEKAERNRRLAAKRAVHPPSSGNCATEAEPVLAAEALPATVSVPAAATSATMAPLLARQDRIAQAIARAAAQLRQEPDKGH